MYWCHFPSIKRRLDPSTKLFPVLIYVVQVARGDIISSPLCHSFPLKKKKKSVWFEIHLKPTLVQVLGTEFFIFMLLFFSSSRAEFIFSALRNRLWKSKNFIMSVFSLSSDFSNCPLISFYKVCLDQNPLEICMLHLADTPLNIKYNSSLASPLSLNILDLADFICMVYFNFNMYLYFL